MKIVFPLLNLNKSGGTRIALQYCSELSKLNYEVVILITKDDIIKEKQIFNIPTHIKVEYLNKNIFSKYFIYFSQIISFYNKINKNDIVFATSWQSYFISILNFHPFNKTILLIQHDDDVIISKKLSFKRLLFRIIYILPIKKVTVSKWLNKHLKIKYKINSITISNGIESINEIIKKINPYNDHFDVMCIARNAKWKGFNDYLTGCELAIKKIPNLRMIIVSHEEMKIKTHIPYIIHKPKNDEELFLLYKNANCFVFPSWIEGFGLPPLEAMSNFTPVITTNCGGVLDYAVDHFNCLLVDIKNPNEIAKSLFIIQSDKQLVNKLVSNALSTSLNYTIKKMALNFEEHILKSFYSK